MHFPSSFKCNAFEVKQQFQNMVLCVYSNGYLITVYIMQMKEQDAKVLILQKYLTTVEISPQQKPW